MKNSLITLFIFTTTICISQSIKIDSNKRYFTIKEIDSICLKNGSPNIISEGKIESKVENSNKSNVVIGNGGFSNKIYLYHFNEAKYNTLTNIEKRKYDFDQYSSLIKGEYHEGINYRNSYSENIYGEFYYLNDLLFFIKIKIIRTEKNKEDISQIFNFSVSELNDSKSIKNIFLFEVKSWVKKRNDEILKIYNKK